MFRTRVAAVALVIVTLGGCSSSDAECEDAREVRAEAVEASTQNREVSEMLSKYAAWEAADELVTEAC
jgi:PBP1b-binding outer membrane lipoprotein LpoB